MPPARPTDTRRSGRAPAYGTRTPYLLDTDHGTARRARRNTRCVLRGGASGCRRTNGPARARQARTDGKDVFDCRRIREIPASAGWPTPAAERSAGRPGNVRRCPRPGCNGNDVQFDRHVNHGLHIAIHALQLPGIQHPDHRRLRRLVCRPARSHRQAPHPGAHRPPVDGQSRRLEIRRRAPSSKCASIMGPATASTTSGARRSGSSCLAAAMNRRNRPTYAPRTQCSRTSTWSDRWTRSRRGHGIRPNT